MEILTNLVNVSSTFLYTYFLVFVLLFCGFYFTIRTNFIQLRFLPSALSVLLEKSHKEHISPFGALMISTASRVGIGNIVGVAVAISSGGAGALFWMWITAILGGASAFIESTLAQVYKQKDGENGYKGGPAYYIQSALGSRAFGIVFAISLILCFTYGFNGLQAYTLTSSFEIFVGSEAYHNGQITIYVGILLALLCAIFFFGSNKASARISSILVPIAQILLCCLSCVQFQRFFTLSFAPLPLVWQRILSHTTNPQRQSQRFLSLFLRV